MTRNRVQTATASANLDSSDASRRVIVRYADGNTLRGYFTSEETRELSHPLSEKISIRSVAGIVEDVEISGLKAIFFVKSFEGTRDYSEFKVFTHQPSGRGVWVRVHFHDGEVMEGIAPNSLGTFASKAFTLTPPDPRSNNESVIVSKHCLKEMQILGLASD